MKTAIYLFVCGIACGLTMLFLPPSLFPSIKAYLQTFTILCLAATILMIVGLFIIQSIFDGWRSAALLIASSLVMAFAGVMLSMRIDRVLAII